MSVTVPRLIDTEVRPPREEELAGLADLHRLCFPDKIESLLGAACIVDVYRERFLGPRADTFFLLAVVRSSGRLAAFVYGSDPRGPGGWEHAFISKHVLMRHMIRSGWRRPRVWRYVAGRVLRKVRGGSVRNEGDTMPITRESSVIKMVGVHPDFRYGNVGIEIMLAAEQEAQRLGAVQLLGLVERSNHKAERLYRYIGWERTSPESADYAVFGMSKALPRREG